MWPAVLAARLLANPKTAHFALVNEGIAGNRVLSDNGAIGGANTVTATVAGVRSVSIAAESALLN